MNTDLEQSEVNVPRVLLEFLVYGTYDKDTKQSKKVMRICKELQQQITNARGNRHKTRILWYADAGEKSDSEKKEWLINKAKCKYYIILASDFDKAINVSLKNYVKNALTKIKLFENAFKSLKSDHICIAQKYNDSIETAILIED